MSVNLIDKHKRKEALKKLTDRYGLKEYMGELFINELLLTWDQVPFEQKAVVVELGLYDAKRVKREKAK